ncbi:hypothetical protein [Streptomyces albipurpureus]|uniref:Uncharacterized protein n=1 Tax=Streptomyces albipurpureus TaxID=2897419 RepID=A0ABT0V0Q6_9ACTN|nr:hypothetical protein [Streptomyces sp. CWNU-1]MCM2393905.1 hypothetical protein [Streptomyces sp. CWNU-1]
MRGVPPHVRTRATVVRAGDRTTLVSLAAWYGGQVLVPVETWVITVATDKRLRDLPGTELSVRARLSARTEAGLALEDWALYTPPSGSPGRSRRNPGR